MELFLAFLDQFRYVAGSVAMGIILCHRSLPHRPQYLKRIITGALIWIALAFLYVPLRSWLEPAYQKYPIVIAPYWLAMSLAPILYLYYCYSSSWAGILFRAMMAMFTENIITVSIRNLFVYTLFPSFPQEHPLLYLLLLITAYTLFCLVIFHTLGRRIQPDEMAQLENDRGTTRTFLLVYFGYTVLLLLSKYVTESMIAPLADYAALTGIHRYLQYYLVGIMLLLSVALTTILCYIYHGLALQKEKEVIVRLARDRQAQYEFSKENIEMINRKTHDLKHQLRALALVSDEERKSQIQEASKAVDFYDAVVKTGNEALDVLLTEKSVYCTNRQIRLSCMVTTKQLEKIRLVDLYTLLGNALDNAIESVERVADPEKKIISLSILDRGSMLYIQLENYYDGVLDIQNGMPQTRKADTQNHGFGLRSINSIVSHYGGKVNIRAENQIFYLEVMIP